MVQDRGGAIALACERRNGFSGNKGNGGTLSVVTERKAGEVGTAMVGSEGLARRGHRFMFPHREKSLVLSGVWRSGELSDRGAG